MPGDMIPKEVLESKIFLIRGHKVMLDRDLAALYGVEVKALNQAVKRNMERFPPDFMFILDKQEAQVCSRSQFVTLKRGQNIKYLPYAFTENGIAMLSSVLNSSRAIQVNVQIMRTFTRLRELLAGHADLRRKIEELERRYDGQFRAVFQAIRGLIDAPARKVRKIGFTPPDKTEN
ncbi:MAG: ORF6N domain-containing protein [Elusimicrobiales bacterium]|nr:ORF6N domain-containing protein [Elusimicrobiales bacterium]